ncbi:hypothetical protein FE257_003611 [Aspergillus nanangensis]|uniref:Zn(2)-C6 fungal-type domain-containing protein n=1 Tax=Aspergillus nanangensis TaxID=2582783 RepID=A0AAD4CRY8_ASPNN|nr:hypothetical protein FE257_003611 [Aspergillus nanangensis]
MSAIRKKLACAECTRRKIRCDKVVPCRNCTRRIREQDDGQVERLRARIHELEASLREVTANARTPADQIASTTASVASVGRTQDTPETEMEDAATVLEFLAWGRRKNPDYRQVGLVAQQSSPGDITADDDGDDRSNNIETGGASALAYIQSLLPLRAQVEQLVDWHCECLLWYHSSFHSHRLRDELRDFYATAEGQIAHRQVDLQWVALLFAILTGALACAPRTTAQAWGFPKWEQTALSQRWFKAVSTCLHQGDFAACHSIYAVQSIATLTMSAHLLGFSNSLSVLLAAAVRIGQGLGLHRLGPEREEECLAPAEVVDREIGRRAWCQLCIQDWFSIPFSESYLIARRGVETTSKPRNCRDDDMIPRSHDAPTLTSYSRFFYDVAALMPSLHDALLVANTPYTRYEQVLDHDRQLRQLATQDLPYYLQNVPLDASWPCYVPWARRSLAISSSHKIIMIHRKFLEASFSNPVFARTRRTCVAAARTIIKEQKEAIDDGGPVLWIHQAFSVTASIILCLDLFHRTVSDPETTYHRQLIQDGLQILLHSESNMIARRGVHLLEALLSRERCRRSTPNVDVGDQRMSLDLVDLIRDFCEQSRWRAVSRIGAPARPSWPTSEMDQGWPPENLVGRANRQSILSPPSLEAALGVPYGLECADSLQDILSLASNYV